MGLVSITFTFCSGAWFQSGCLLLPLPIKSQISGLSTYSILIKKSSSAMYCTQNSVTLLYTLQNHHLIISKESKWSENHWKHFLRKLLRPLNSRLSGREESFHFQFSSSPETRGTEIGETKCVGQENENDGFLNGLWSSLKSSWSRLTHASKYWQKPTIQEW